MNTPNPEVFNPRHVLEHAEFKVYADGDEVPTGEEVNLACELTSSSSSSQSRPPPLSDTTSSLSIWPYIECMELTYHSSSYLFGAARLLQ